MRTTLILLGLVLLFTTASCGHLPAKEDRTCDNIWPYINAQLQEKYWYYLTKACLLYLTTVERGVDHQFLAIYRNIVGTFLAIVTWHNEDDYFTVNTLVRLGNGYAKNSGAHYKPVAVEPLKLRYSLGDDEYIIEVHDCGDIHVNGKSIHHITKETAYDE